MTKQLTPYEKLPAKHRRFVDSYLIYMNAAEAARASGYKGINSKVNGSMLYNTPEIRGVIDQKIKEREEEDIITQREVLKDLIIIKNQAMGREQVRNKDGDYEYRYNAATAVKTLELLGKHLGMFTDKVQVSVRSHEEMLLELDKIGKGE